jgi:hypothetical protein
MLRARLMPRPNFVNAARTAFPAVDSARLDVMHAGLWGRAEGVRSTIVYAVEAAAPPLFGWLSGMLSGQGGAGAWAGNGREHAGNLAFTFLILLITLAAAGIAMLFGVRSYPRDVATIAASEQASDAPASPSSG